VSALYLETSALLAWLLGESAASQVATALTKAETVVTSVLTLTETRRVLVRAETGGVLSAAQAAHLRGIAEVLGDSWHLLEISREVRERASSPFPREPIRTLDAIHLASALTFSRAFRDVQVLTLDRRVAGNLAPLGLSEPLD